MSLVVAPSRRRRHARAGLTFLEVVVSIAILGGVASMVFGVIGFSERAAQYDRSRLHAMEVAHRVVVQWIDDPEWIRNQPRRYEYLGMSYLFDVQEKILLEDEAGDAIAVDEAGLSAENIVQSALRVLDVRVWREGEEGYTTTQEPLVHMTRTYSLFATQRGTEELFRILLNNGRGDGDG